MHDLAEHPSDRVVFVGELLERAFHPPFGHALAGMLPSVEPDAERALADRQAVDVLSIEALAEELIADALNCGGLGDEVVVPLHRIGREIGDPDEVLRRGQLHRQNAVCVARVLDSNPFLAVEAHHPFVVGPSVRIGGAGAIGDSQSDRSPAGAGKPEIEPLIEIAHVVRDDLEVDAVAVLVDHSDVTRIERAGNGQCHAIILAVRGIRGG